FRRFSAIATRARSPMPSASSPDCKQARVVRCLEHWYRSSWAPSPSSKAVVSMPAASPIFSRTRRTILLRHFRQASADCSAEPICSNRWAIRSGGPRRQVGKTRGRPAVGNAPRAAAAAVARAADDTRRSAQAAVPSTNWLMWAILALAIAALLFYLLARPGEQVVQQGVTTEQNIIVGGLNLNQQVTD